jgi:UDP-GlcNAc3NAcA epimerase
MKIVTVIGARPQFVKAAVVSRVLRAMAAFEEILVHTGQHYDENMSQTFFDELEIPRPAFHLKIGSGTHGKQTGRMLEAIEAVLQETQPDALLVYGDTNSTLAGALAAAKLQIPIAHVEAGLRSFNRRMPEEINRIVTDRLSHWLFAPTQAAVAHLHQEGVADSSIFLVGDVMYDAALHFGQRARWNVPPDWGLIPKHYILATIHRAENTDNIPRLRTIFAALKMAARQMPVVLPLHPRTRAVLEREGLLADCDRHLRLCDPVGYLEMTAMEKDAALIVTDSGGVQKEAFFHRVPCLTLRDETEWTELVDLGWNTLVPLRDASLVADKIGAMLRRFSPQEPPASLYGGGQAANRIAEILLQSDKEPRAK